MNFGETEQVVEQQTQDDTMLANVFAQFGVDIMDKSEEANVEKVTEKEEEMNIPLPDFNTLDFKVKRILDSINDYNYLF